MATARRAVGVGGVAPDDYAGGFSTLVDAGIVPQALGARLSKFLLAPASR